MNSKQSNNLLKQRIATKSGDIPSKNVSKSINDLSDDDMLIIFSFLDLSNQFVSRRVCHRWRVLVGYVFSTKRSLSFVNHSENVLNWKDDHWCEVMPYRKEYTKVKFDSLNTSLNRILKLCPNITDLDMECYDFNTQTIRTIAANCPKLERINFDSSNGFSLYLATPLVSSFSGLKRLNLSCVSKISENFLAKLLKSLRGLTALNICGTEVTGHSLSMLSPNMMHLNISYCWKLKGTGLLALTQSNCDNLRELFVNNFNFDTQSANESLSAICSKFTQLRRLEMSLGPCTEPNFFIRSLHYDGLSTISRLKHLEVLIIRKICILDDSSLRDILLGCPLLKELVLDMFGESTVTDLSIAWVANCCNLEFLEISRNKQISAQTLTQVVRHLSKLRALTLRFTNADNQTLMAAMTYNPDLRSINVNGCQKVSQESLLSFIQIARTKPLNRYEFTAIASDIGSHSIHPKTSGTNNQIPDNIEFKVSTGRTRQYLWYESGRFYYSRTTKHI